ncbi:glycosyltransferase [Echinimonas agarilytica]|uniref:Glycosyltransferase n=1 Tax=Echinimonas agarilytica TaxID=1215918 RepID=A0AA41W9D5_9GAMM|nr:glycosyltransferase [Echinimonas agarilytica]MCM2681499.1 glycosyltransferase [Echinimonas agarilytica]
MAIQQKPSLLMIALEVPPCRSAGVQRTLKFAEYLVQKGWRPIILTVESDIYKNTDAEPYQWPEGVEVVRTKALDSSKAFSIKGKYFAWSAIPDKWWTWLFSAIPAGKRLIQQHNPALIWSTYPVSTAHFIAWRLSKASGLPWVADYRDPLQVRYDPAVERYSTIAKWIERKVMLNATRVVCTADKSKQLYQSIYPQLPDNKYEVIQNGFDEGNFNQLTTRDPSVNHGKFVFLYSGALYPRGRDPVPLFKAIQALKKSGVVCSEQVEFRFRGAGDGAGYQTVMQQLDVADCVRFMPPVSYQESLQEMLNSDALLLIQGELFNNQIPGKLYEYIRVGQPILALTPEQSATAQVVQDSQRGLVAENAEGLEQAISAILAGFDVPDLNAFDYSREQRADELDQLFTGIIKGTH